MSLSKQMILFITALLLILLLGTFLLNLNNTRSFLEHQLQSHAQDTATSLGLSLSSVADPAEPSSMETMINAVFDRGYYAHITLKDVDGHLLYQRTNPQEIEGIPNWFIQLISIQAPDAEALIQSGWIPIGNLTVKSHTGYAYIELWKTAINLSIWFLLAAIIAIVLVAYALRVMLKPLKQMEKQAEAIVKKEYLLQEQLPTTIEFKRVVSAMNVMVQKMQKMAYQDSVTGLSNRLHFEMNVDALLDEHGEASPGVIGLVRLEGLKSLNDQYGYMIGDKLMRMVADKLQQTFLFEHTLFARLNGSELVAVIPSVSGAQAAAFFETLCGSMTSLLSDLKADNANCSLSTAYMDYQLGHRRGELLAKLDFAIAESQKLGPNQSYYYQPESEQALPHSGLHELIESAIEENRFVLFQQTAYDQSRKVHDKELLIRLKDQQNNIHSAGYFMPAVKQMNRLQEIDQKVIQLAIEHLQQHPNETDERLAINLTPSLLQDNGFKDWLLHQLTQINANQIAFEMPEQMVNEDKQHAWPLLQEIKQFHIHFGIDHFGSHFTNMNYLQTLRPDYIKLDAAFTKAIERDEQTRSYVSSLIEMCSSLDIDVIAMSVENETQIQAFKELGVQYFQGYYFGAPKPL